jgi:RNA ligase
MELLVQQYLKTHSFGQLAAEHGVYASFAKSGRKFSLNYDQIEAKEGDPLAQECRGLILSLEFGQFVRGEESLKGLNRDDTVPGATRILAFPMRRFFNYGQGSAAHIDWNDPNTSILEKLDGTLCIVYYDLFVGVWCVATRSVPEADLIMDNSIFTFRTLFEKAFKDTTGQSFADATAYPSCRLNTDYTYCFELTTPYNRIVVYYPNNGITLLAVRDIVSHQELDINDESVIYSLPNVPLVQSYPLTTVEKIIDWVASLNPMEHEGIVAKRGEDRIKIKNPAYVAYNKVRDSMASSERNMVELILAEKDDDVIPMLPEELAKNLLKIKAHVQEVIKEHDQTYHKIKSSMELSGLSDKKNFAMAVQEMSKLRDGQLWTAPFFQMFDGKASSMKDFIQKNRKDGSWGAGFLDKFLDLSKS